MWKVVCPKNSNIRWEHHSEKEAHEFITNHEKGFKHGWVSEDPCNELHEYWDDGLVCSATHCNYKYVPAADGDYFVD